MPDPTISSTAIIWSGLPTLCRGMGVTLILVISALAAGMLLGAPLGVAHVYARRGVRIVLWLFDRIFRGFPTIVLLFLIYFGLGSLPGVSIQPLTAVILVLGLRSAAYQAQIYRGALLMIERGQTEAALALGFSLPKTVLFILLPQALRFSLPSLSNEYSVVLKDTALAFTVGVIDLMSRAKFLAMRSRETLIVYLLIAAAYFILTHAGIALFRAVERGIAIPGLGQQRAKRRA
ncbi:MAG: amino acid ABC transporter permease [Candidatus Atribacteria bacterium]|nr:MAG: amino acid ABC transporter permease [Candidatus Atribacteria bacterium]